MSLHTHDFLPSTDRAELRTRIVMVMTGLMMVVEITAGTLFHSMALLADGWHMSTHLAAFLIATLAYSFARRNRSNPRFTFGTGKVGVVGGFASSILLIVVALAMIAESANRLLHPAPIDFLDALVVAVIGLLVNLVSAVLLKDDHHHDHSNGHRGPSHDHDKNLKAAYIHVVADAFTSVTAIFALLVGLFFGIVWIDALIGFLGSAVIISWATNIIRDTLTVLVDAVPVTTDLVEEIHRGIESDGTSRIVDFHLWQVAPGRFGAIVCVESARPRSLEDYHSAVAMHEELVHVSIEIRRAVRPRGHSWSEASNPIH